MAFVAQGHISTRMLRFVQGVRGTWIAEPIPGLNLIIRETDRGFWYAGQLFQSLTTARNAAEAQFAGHIRACLIVTPMNAAAGAPTHITDRRAA